MAAGFAFRGGQSVFKEELGALELLNLLGEDTDALLEVDELLRGGRGPNLGEELLVGLRGLSSSSSGGLTDFERRLQVSSRLGVLSVQSERQSGNEEGKRLHSFGERSSNLRN